MTDDEIKKLIAVRIANGSLSSDLVQFPGSGPEGDAAALDGENVGGKPDPALLCAVCEQNKTDLAIVKDDRSFPFHARCLYVYQDEMGRG